MTYDTKNTKPPNFLEVLLRVCVALCVVGGGCVALPYVDGGFGLCVIICVVTLYHLYQICRCLCRLVCVVVGVQFANNDTLYN